MKFAVTTIPPKENRFLFYFIFKNGKFNSFELGVSKQLQRSDYELASGPRCCSCRNFSASTPFSLTLFFWLLQVFRSAVLAVIIREWILGLEPAERLLYLHPCWLLLRSLVNFW